MGNWLTEPKTMHARSTLAVHQTRFFPLFLIHFFFVRDRLVSASFIHSWYFVLFYFFFIVVRTWHTVNIEDNDDGLLYLIVIITMLLVMMFFCHIVCDSETVRARKHYWAMTLNRMALRNKLCLLDFFANDFELTAIVREYYGISDKKIRNNRN